MNILMCKYNNYFNKMVKKESSISAYQDYAVKTYVNINFELNDGVNTSLVLNMDEQIFPNYIVCYKDDTIDSRWFILEQEKIRNHQYRFTLKRDVMVDFWNDIIKSPMYIEKATLNNNDPMIFNSEGMLFNQIKTSEHLLKDAIDTPWLAIYLAKEFDVKGLIGTDGFEIRQYNNENWLMRKIVTQATAADEVVNTHDDLPYINLEGMNLRTKNSKYSIKIPTRLDLGEEQQDGYIVNNFSIDGYEHDDFYFVNDDTSLPQILISESSDTIGAINNVNTGTSYVQSIANTINIYNLDELLRLDGKTYSVEEDPDTIYVYNVREIDANEVINVQNGSYQNQLIDSPIYDEAINSGLVQLLQTKTFPKQLSNSEVIEVSGKFVRIDIEILASVDRTFFIPITTVTQDGSNYTPDTNGFKANNHTSEAYDVLMIPFSTLSFNGTLYSTNDRNARMQIATNLFQSSAIVADIQIVPYSPIRYDIVNNRIVLSGNYDINPILHLGRDNILRVIDNGIFLRNVQFTKHYQYNIRYDDKKISNECDSYRLCSPNYSSVYEFTPAQFTFGSDMNPITTWNVDCVLKPIQPYIHVYPNFDGLLGSNFNDARGLICEGEFSISQLNDAFTNYALQNKNYDAQFKRSIQNMKTNFKLGMAQSIINGAGQTVTQGIGGALLGGPAGAVGGITAGALDTMASAGFSYAQFREQKDFAKDNYNMSLQNIRAVPDTLTKVTAFNQNNKIYPFIEYYTCTDAERDALRSKLKYDGMTVNRIGMIKDFFRGEEQFIKGEMIRLESLEEDYHLASEIYGCLLRGVFIYD